jgi:hypothetical protein
MDRIVAVRPDITPRQYAALVRERLEMVKKQPGKLQIEYDRDDGYAIKVLKLDFDVVVTDADKKRMQQTFQMWHRKKPFLDVDAELAVIENFVTGHPYYRGRVIYFNQVK